MQAGSAIRGDYRPGPKKQNTVKRLAVMVAVHPAPPAHTIWLDSLWQNGL